MQSLYSFFISTYCTKGIVKREVVRVVTPGTNLNTQALDEGKNNYIMCIVYIGDKYDTELRTSGRALPFRNSFRLK